MKLNFFSESETNFRLLFEHMNEGFAYCEMIYDKDLNPWDFVYIETNQAFEELTGLKKVIGKKVTEILPEIKETHPELFALYGNVAKTGKPEKTELYFKPLSIWFSLSVYSPKKGYFVAVFDNITKRKKSEEELLARTQELEKLNKLAMDRELKMVELKEKIRITEEKLNAANLES